MAKLKMSNKRFMLITIPLIVILLALVITVTALMNYHDSTMDMFFGRGKMNIKVLEGTENWNTDYYGTIKDSSVTKANAVKSAKKISDEGIILLKNNGSLPLSPDSKVTPFGRDFVDPIYGGGGSGNVDTSQDYVVTAEEALTDSFGEANINMQVVDRLKTVLKTDGGEDGKYRRGKVNHITTGKKTTHFIGEFPASEYESVDASITAYGDAGIVFIGRPGGEGNDLTQDMSDHGGADGQHQLELDANEKSVIEYAKAKCDKVIVVLNFSTSFELGALAEDDGVDAVVWAGSPGAVGFASLGDILVGKINPSGRTVDTFAADFTKDPTWQNFGDFEFTNAVTQYIYVMGTGNAKYMEYEEGIYLGYRYYETAAAVYGQKWYDAWKTSADKATGTGVVYPFGYGLSYTTFTQKIVESNTNGDKVSVTVEVENTGKRDGKEVVQLYYTAPYTNGGIEKSYVNLAAFGKTGVLAANGGKELLTLEFYKEDMASYDHRNAKAYVLDAGEYTIRLMKNAHEQWDSRTFSLTDKIVYDADNPRRSEKDAQSYMNPDGTLEPIPAKNLSDPNATTYTAAVNRFDLNNEYMDKTGGVTNLSRRDLQATFPTRAVNKAAPAAVVEALKVNGFDYNVDPELGNVQTSKIYHADKPAANHDNGLQLIDLRGLNYYDPAWEEFLAQLKYDDNDLALTMGGNYQTQPLEYMGKPATVERDGPQGLTGVVETGQTIDTCAWCSIPLVAATYNTELAYDMGLNVGDEALAVGVSGWYAPGLNLHRTPFSGRNFEYYSEDPLLSGKMAAATVSGAGDNGLRAYLKHFALNDQETNRYYAGASWANEQTMRELYLKSFEICVKEAVCTLKYVADEQGNLKTATMRATTALMTSHNTIGATHSTGSYALLTEVLRNEWGFNGMVITDMYSGIDYDARLRAGNDVSMISGTTIQVKDKTSATALHAYKTSIKNVMYSVVNSNGMIGIAPGTYINYDWSPWAICLLIGNIIVYAAILFLCGWIAWWLIDDKKHPQKYNHSQKT